MNTQIQTVNFNGQTLSVFQQNGKFYVAMKPICENIGLDWDAQRQKIKRNYVLNKGAVMITVPSNGGNQEMICLPLGYLNGWLMNVDVNRVKPEIRETLIRYQMECYDVLFNHFIPQNSGSLKPIPNKTTSLDREPLRNAVNLLVSKKGLNFSEAYTLVHQRFNVAHLDELDSEQLPQAVEYVHRLLTGEVLDKEDTLPNKTIVLTDDELAKFATTTYYLDWATRQLKALSLPLSTLGADKKATNAYTLWHESQIWLKQCREILQKNQPNVQSDYYGNSIQKSLMQMEKLNKTH